MRYMFVGCAAVALAIASPVFGQNVAASEQDLSSPDAAHLAAAERVAVRIWPDGTWRRQMDGMMDGFFSTIMESLAGPSGNLAERFFGKDSKEARQAANPRAASSGNPLAGPEAMDRFMQAMVNAMTPLMTEIEPQIRAGIAASAARRFSAQQLAELDTFFSTPTGGDYARQSMLMLTDPEVLQATMTMMPRMMESMPQIMEQVAAETGIALPADGTAATAADRAAADAAASAAVKIE